jgi:hypothetical protein
MARTKSTRSAAPSRSASTRKAARPVKQASSSNDESLSSASFSRARDFVEANANLQTAGIALAGAGILALVSTQAGRNLIKSATDAVVGLVSQNIASFTNQSGGQESSTRQKPSRQRDQARI